MSSFYSKIITELIVGVWVLIMDFEIKDKKLIKYNGAGKCVFVPDGVKVIGKDALAFLFSTQEIILPKSVTTIEPLAFRYCKSLKRLVIPDSVTSIEYGAFAFCESLTEVNIPSKVNSIENVTFASCASLRRLVIPDSVNFIHEEALYHSIHQIVIKNLDLLQSQNKLAAVSGLPDCYSECTDEQIEKYIAYIKEHADELVIRALEDTRLLKIMVDNCCIPQELIDAYFAEAEKREDIEAKAILLSIKTYDSTDDFDLDDT